MRRRENFLKIQVSIIKNNTMQFAVCAVFALAAGATISAAELKHRWSFNGDYSDSVGGVDAVKCGTYVSLYGGRVHMGYGACSHGTGYVDIGTNMLDTTSANPWGQALKESLGPEKTSF